MGAASSAARARAVRWVIMDSTSVRAPLAVISSRRVKILRYFGASFDYGFFPKLTISGVDVSYSMWNVAARVYPFGDVLFVGAVFGHYGVEPTATVAQGTG